MASKDVEVNADVDTSKSSDDKYALKYGFSIDLAYIKSLHGILTAGITVVSLIAFICMSVGRSKFECDYEYGSSYDFFGFVSMSAFLTGLLNYILYMFTFYDKLILKFVPWALADLIWCGLWTFLYLVGSSVIAAKACGRSGNAAAAVFGFGVMIAMGVKAFFAFRKFQEEREAKTGKGPQSESTPDAMEQY